MPAVEPLSDGLRLRVRVTPRGGADRVEGLDPAHDALRVRVRAVPEDGKANTAVCATVAAALGVAKGDVTLVSGASARLKGLRVRGDPAALAARLDALLRARFP